MRAVAALMVVMHHAKSSVLGSVGWPSFGAAGVDVFFVISGFVMAHTLRHARDDCAGRRRDLAGQFLLKRIVRVVPMYWLAVLWTNRRELAGGSFSPDLLKDLLFIPHPNAAYPDMLWPTVIQGWTLNYEMYFYVLFAVTIALSRRYFTWLTVVLAIITAAGFFGGLSGTNAAAASPYLRFYTHDIILEFAFGIVLQRAVLRFGYPLWPRWSYGVLVAIGFVLLAHGYDATPRAAFEGVPSALIVWASIPLFSQMRLPAWEEIGNASYAIYLFHWASFGVVKSWATFVHRWEGDGLSTPVAIAVLMCSHFACALITGLLIHRLLERPMLRVAEGLFSLSRTKAAQ